MYVNCLKSDTCLSLSTSPPNRGFQEWPPTSKFRTPDHAMEGRSRTPATKIYFYNVVKVTCNNVVRYKLFDMLDGCTVFMGSEGRVRVGLSSPVGKEEMSFHLCA